MKLNHIPYLDQKYNFKKYSRTQVDSLNVPYDYDSIMHYDKRALAWWPLLTTIRPKKSGVSIGLNGISVNWT